MEDYSKKTPLHYAAKENNINAVKILLESNADFSKKDVLGMIPLHYAAKEGHNGVIELLLKAGSNVDEQDIFEWTSLHLAAYFSRIEAIKALLKEGADPLLENRDGKTPRELAQNAEVKQLLEKAEDKRAADNAIHILNKPDNGSYAYEANIPHSTKGNKLPIITASAGLLSGLGIAYLAGAATLTPVGAVVAVFLAATVVGALVGYGVGKISSKFFDTSITAHDQEKTGAGCQYVV